MDQAGSNLLIVCGFLFLTLLLLVNALMKFQDFRSELRGLKIEISRTTGRERKYWKRQRRKLWASLLPFVKY